MPTAAETRPFVRVSEVDSAGIQNAKVQVHFPLQASANAVVSLGDKASTPFRIAKTSKAAIDIAMRGASEAPAEYADGQIVYRGAMGPNISVIHTPLRSGTQDYVVFDKPVEHPQIEYAMTLSPAIAGLRMVANTVEFLDAKGAPLFHVAPPSVIDVNGRVDAAQVSLPDCKYDTSSARSKKRTVIAAGKDTCTLRITWSNTLNYPLVLDPSWTSSESMIVPHSEHTATMVGSWVLIVGGVTDTGPPTNFVEWYNPGENWFQAEVPMNFDRARHTATHLPNDDVVVVGGDSTTGVQNTSETLHYDPDTSTYTWSLAANTLNTGRAAHVAAYLPSPNSAANPSGLVNAVIASGGRDASFTALSDSEVFDPGLNSWRQTALPPAMNNSRFAGGATVVDTGCATRFYVVGGTGSNSAAGEYYVANNGCGDTTNLGQWVSLPNMSTGRSAFSTVYDPVQNLIWAIGGLDATGHPSVTADILNVGTGAWRTPVTYSASGRYGMASVFFPAGPAVFGGRNPDDANSEKTETDLYSSDSGWQLFDIDGSLGFGSSATPIPDLNNRFVLLAGGTDWSGTPTAEAKFIQLDPTGGSCTSGATCASGGCSNGACLSDIDQTCSASSECGSGFCQVLSWSGPTCRVAHPVSIDATGLSNKGLILTGGTGIIDTSQVVHLQLAENTYWFQVYSGVISSVSFTVMSNGTVDYDPSLDGILLGRGTSTLVVVGKQVIVDATQLSQGALDVLAFNFIDGSGVHLLYFDTSTPHSFMLLPIPDNPGYQFLMGSGMVSDLFFGVDLAGNVHVPGAEAFAATANGNVLTMKGFYASIDIPPGLGNPYIDALAPVILHEGENDIRLLPFYYGYSFMVGSTQVTFNVDAQGNLTGDPVFLSLFGIHSSAAPYCSDETSRAASNGWSLTPAQCQGQAPLSGDVSDVLQPPSPVLSPQAIRRASPRPPNRVPRHNKVAGGDPVLSDGEFFIQRTDAELAGFGPHYQFVRTYRSGVETGGPLGRGWNHSYNQRILGQVVDTRNEPTFDPLTLGDVIGPDCDGTVQYQDGEGNLEQFTGTSWTTDSIGLVYHFIPESGGLRLDFNATSRTWTLTRPDGVALTFDQGGYLHRIYTLTGNSLFFDWEGEHESILRNCPEPAGTTNPVCHDSSLTTKQIGQHKRLVRVRDAARTVNYVYYPLVDDTKIDSNNALQCVSLGPDCTSNSTVLASFSIDNLGRLTAIAHGPTGTSSIESYHYWSNPGLPEKCMPSADISNYCERLCGNWANSWQSCKNLGHNSEKKRQCATLDCCDSTNAICSLPDSDYTFGGKMPDGTSKISCAGGNLLASGDHCDLCQQYFDIAPTSCLDDGDTSACVAGCEYVQQCHGVVVNVDWAFYMYGLRDELWNNISDVYDQNNQRVVHNEYNEDETNVAFGRVKTQQLGSAASNNVISFQYHDLVLEGDPSKATVYAANPPIQYWPARVPMTYQGSNPDPMVQNFALPSDERLAICPRTCAASDPSGGCIYDYQAVTQNVGVEFGPVVFAVVISDLHNTRIQYLDDQFLLTREVTVETREVTDYNYALGLTTAVLGPRAADADLTQAVRNCMELDDRGRVTQTSVVPAAGYQGSAVTQATTMVYDANGQITDVTRDALGAPYKTHFSREDAFDRVTQIVQQVDANNTFVFTEYFYDETPPTGFLESPSRIIYPNGRVDHFSDYDPMMGGARTSTIDESGASPEYRYAKYDSPYGRLTEEGESGRFAQRYAYADLNDISRLTSVGHNLSSNNPATWVDKAINSHLVNGAPVVDSTVEATRRTNVAFSSGSAFPTQKDLVATPPGTPPTQTSCFNYAADGRLEAVILPEGNGIAYSYAYHPDGTTISSQRGYPSGGEIDTNGAWATACRGRTAPAGDPGMGLPSGRHFAPGGFIDRDFDENNTQRLYTTDGLGRVIQIASTTQAVAMQQFGYDTAGRLLWQSLRTPGSAYSRPAAPFDSTVLAYTEYDHDYLGRVTAERVTVVPTGEVFAKSYGYNDTAGTVVATDRGVQTIMAYDGRGRLVSTTLPDGSVPTVAHVVGTDTATVPTNRGTNFVRTFNYDSRGLLLNIHDGDDSNGVFRYIATYDDDGNQRTEQRLGQGLVTWTYDAFGRLVQEDRALTTSSTATSKYGYDGNNRLTTYYDAKNSSGGSPWLMTFTGQDAPLTIIDPLTRTGSYAYSNGANWPRTLVANMHEPNGRDTWFGYDSLGRLTDVYKDACPSPRDPSSCGVVASQRHLTYDMRGVVEGVDGPVDQNGNPILAPVQLAHDSIGRVLEEDVGVAGAQSNITHSFSSDGRSSTTEISYAPATVSASIDHVYDGMNRLSTVGLTGQNPLATYSYGVGAGIPLSLTYSNGAVASFSQDNKLRQTGIDVTFGGNTVASMREAFGADSIPRIRQRQIGTMIATDVFEVDLAGRLNEEGLRVPSVTFPSGETDNSYANTWMPQNAVPYTLDKISNITAAGSAAHTVDNLSRLTAIANQPVALDSSDDLLGRNGDAVQFTFDLFTGTVATATGIEPNTQQLVTSAFSYDALGRRRTEHRSDGTDHISIWDGNRLVGHGTVDNLTLDVPGDDIDSHIVSIDQFGATSGSQWFYHQGPDQSTLAVTGSAGLVEGYTYSAFGELSIWNPSGNSQVQSAFANIFQYQGQVYDASTATYSMRARQYQPAWGRFLSPDPISVAGGPSLYSFTGSQPLNSRDPLGLVSCDLNIGRCYLSDRDAASVGILGGGIGGYGSAIIGVSDLQSTTWEVHSQETWVSTSGPIPVGDEAGHYASVFSTDSHIIDFVTNEMGPISWLNTNRVFAGPVTLEAPTTGRAPEFGPVSVRPPPPAPPGVNVDDNIRVALRARALISAQHLKLRYVSIGDSAAKSKLLWWFYNQVRNKGPWDYKQRGRQYQDFGNFNFGAVGHAAGLSDELLLRGAGWAQQRAGTSDPSWGTWKGGPPYGDDPADQSMIKQGIDYSEAVLPWITQ